MKIIDWLKQDELFTIYHVENYLLENYDEANLIKSKISKSNFAKTIIEKQNSITSLWGEGVYSPKYISTHYTLLTLCELEVDLSEKRYLKAIDIMLDTMWKPEGKINKYRHQDLCVVAMMIRICSQARIYDSRLFEMIDYVINHKMIDGGFNCRWEKQPSPKQSSLHSTLSVMEAFENLFNKGYDYRLEELSSICKSCAEYILTKKMYKSVRTNEIIHSEMLKFPFPYGWKYDILRAFYVMANLDIDYDERMEDGLNFILTRLDNFGRIKSDRLSVGKHFGAYKKTNQLSPFNTFRVLRILKKYKFNEYSYFLNKKML